jgi:uncharacterized protein
VQKNAVERKNSVVTARESFMLLTMKVFLTLLLFTVASVVSASPIPDFPFLFVGGHASEQVPTARAQISFSIQNENEKSQDGETELQKASIAMKTLLKENGIPEKDIDASDVSKRRVSKDPFDEEKKQVYFEFSQSFVVTITDLKLYPKLAEMFIGSDKVSGFNSSFYAGNLRDVRKRLRVEALKDAKENAETIAKAAGTTLGVIHSISELDHSELAELIGAESYHPPNLPPGLNEVYQVPPTVNKSFYVRVLYRLPTGENDKTQKSKTD